MKTMYLVTTAMALALAPFAQAETGSTAPPTPLGVEVQAEESEGILPLTYLEHRTVRVTGSAHSITDAALLQVRATNANAASDQAFAVVACDQIGTANQAQISLLRPKSPFEIVTSAGVIGNIAFSNIIQELEGQGETLFAALSTPVVPGGGGNATAGYDIHSAGYRALSVTMKAQFWTDAPPTKYFIGGPALGCGTANPF